MDHSVFSVHELAADESFQDYVMGKGNQAYWQEWIAANPSQKATVDQAREVVVNLYKMYVESLGAKGLGNHQLVREQLMANLPSQSQQRKAKQVWLQSPIVRVAASISVIIIAAYFSWKYVVPTDMADEDPSAVEQVAWIEKVVPAGQKSTLKLSDGTVIKLNAETKIRMPEKFADIREVYLEGEAFFDVARDTLRPFIIYSKNTMTKVLGTSFNIKAYAQDSIVSVAVLTGKVSVRIKDDRQKERLEETVLLPNDLGVVLGSGDGILTSKFDAEKLLAWKDGVLILDNDSFDKALEKLERWYGVRFIKKNEGKVKEYYSGSFKNESLKNVLEALKVTGGFSYKIQGDFVELAW